MKEVTELIIGIRHSANFSILDNWGEIVDSILSNKSIYFGDDYFPKISDNYTTERVLFNDATGNYLKITGHDIIYRHALENTFENEFNTFLERVTKGIVPLIIQKYDVKNFIRVGIVFKCKISSLEKYNSILKNISTIENINDIRFSYKDTTEKGKLFGNNNDYTNKLYTLAIDSEGKPIFIYDYQYYFNPLRSTYLECKFDELIKAAKVNVDKDFEELMGEENGKQ